MRYEQLTGEKAFFGNTMTERELLETELGNAPLCCDQEIVCIIFGEETTFGPQTTIREILNDAFGDTIVSCGHQVVQK